MAVYRATVKAKVAGQEINNVVHFFKEVVDQNTKLQLAHAIDDRLVGQWVFLQCRELRWFEVVIQRPHDPDDVVLVFPLDKTGLHQSISGYILPVTAVFQLNTNVRGRTGRGRICIAAPPSGEVVSSLWNSNYLATMGSVAQSHVQWFMGDAPQSGFSLVVAPRHPEGEEYKPVVHIGVRNFPGTQVRRNFFRGK